MANLDIKNYARIKDVKLWQIAEKLNLCDSNFSRKLRVELSEEEKKKIKDIIDNLATDRVETRNTVMCNSCGKEVLNKRFCCECGKILK